MPKNILQNTYLYLLGYRDNLSLMYAEIFNQLMKLMRPFMKAQGFTSRGNNFYKRHPEGNIGIINFQKNRDGFPRFTVNVGIYSVVLAKYFLAEFNQKTVKEYPSLGDYHWESRIVSLVPVQNPARQGDEDWRKFGDKWWWYDDSTNVEQLFKEISRLIMDFGIPAIEQRITDKQLIEDILSYKTKNLESWEELHWLLLKNLSVLYKTSGEIEQLESIMRHFKKVLEKDPSDKVVKRHLDKLRETRDEQSIPINPPKKMKP